MKRTAVAIGYAVVALVAGPAHAQTANNVLLVVNDASTDSVQVGEHYARARGVPASQVARITAPLTETIDRTEYEESIQEPLAQWIRRHSLHDRILYIVLTKGVPIRIAGTGGRDATSASVDSELTLLYRRLLGQSPSVLGREANPYFLGDRPLAEDSSPARRSLEDEPRRRHAAPPEDHRAFLELGEHASRPREELHLPGPLALVLHEG